MEYVLAKGVIGFKGYISIDESYYSNIKAAKDLLFEGLYIEEKYDLVIENYKEFESELLNTTLKNVVNWDYDWGKFVGAKNELNRRVVNLLSACRLYIDHVRHHFNQIHQNNTDALEKLKKKISHEYDSNFSYRFLESLRNYVQHRGYPISSCSFPSKRIKEGNISNLQYSLTPYIDIAQLKNDVKFKKLVLAEIGEKTEKIDIKKTIREYIDSVARIHEKLRELLTDDIKKWEKTIYDSIDLFKNKFGPDEKVLGLAAMVRNPKGFYSHRVYIFPDFIDHRKFLERKNKGYFNLSESFISSQIIEDRP